MVWMNFKNRIAVKLTAVLLIACSSVFAQKKVIPELNYTDTNMLKQGPWKKSFPNGKIRYEGQFKDDKPVGLFKYYYESGDLKTTSFFIDRGITTRTKTYYQTGKLLSEGNFINEKKDSIWKFYALDGKLRSEESFSNGVRSGVSKTFYENGNVSKMETYSNDVLNGSFFEYFEDGKIKIEGNYVNGDLNGSYQICFHNQKPMYKGQYENNLKIGVCEMYNEDGSLKYTEQFKNGVVKKTTIYNGVYWDYYPNEIPKEMYTYKDGKKNGAFIEYYDAGQFVKETVVFEQTGDKDEKLTLEGQKIKAEGNYLNDKLDGKITYYRPDGKIDKVVYYKEGAVVKQ